jgi:hypothetical protein
MNSPEAARRSFAAWLWRPRRWDWDCKRTIGANHTLGAMSMAVGECVSVSSQFDAY